MARSEVYMRKFLVSVTFNVDYYVWGNSLEEVQEAFEAESKDALLERTDTPDISVTETPKMDAAHVTDGAVSEHQGWVHLADIENADGLRIIPTDDVRLMPQVGHDHYVKLEAAGQRRFPFLVDTPQKV